jgi:hypothetical protein
VETIKEKILDKIVLKYITREATQVSDLNRCGELESSVNVKAN